MDTVGAVLGPAIAFGILAISSNNMRLVFWLSIIPGLLAIGTIALFVKDIPGKLKGKKNLVVIGSESNSKGSIFSNIDGRFKVFLLIAILFTLGKIPEAFLVLRAKELGVDVRLIPMVYLFFNITSAFLSTPSGIIADRVGKRKVIFLSYLFGAFTYGGFALAFSGIHAWFLFILYGIFIAMNEGNQRAFVAQLIDPERKATGYGIYHTVVGITGLPAGIIGGALYQSFGSAVVFFYSSCLCFVAGSIFYCSLMRR